jgi:hypothetical protein
VAVTCHVEVGCRVRHPPHATRLQRGPGPTATCYLHDSLCHHILLAQPASNEAGDSSTTAFLLGLPPMRPVTPCYLPPATCATCSATTSCLRDLPPTRPVTLCYLPPALLASNEARDFATTSRLCDLPPTRPVTPPPPPAHFDCLQQGR